MENKYSINNSQVGAVGDQSRAENNSFQNVSVDSSTVNFSNLTYELLKLKNELKLKAETPEEFQSLQCVAKAQEESNNKNVKGVLENLKAGGEWVIDTATKIGVSVVSELIKQNLK